VNFELSPLIPAEIPLFKRDMQEAFQMGAVSEFSGLDGQVLPEKDIDSSLDAKGSVAYKATEDGQIIGGVIVVIDNLTQHNHLHLLYVKHGVQSRGTGKKIWDQVEKLHADTKVWETVTPYFEKRNIHFYINRCGFSAVEFYNPYHINPEIPEDMVGGDYFFRFTKVMK
jgi:GNAT superfamily N-acetyltransferase